MSKHVDDFKLVGPRKVIEWILRQIQSEFGELKISLNNFTNCGLRHMQDPRTFEITLDQDEYVRQIKPIIHPDLRSKA